MTNLPENDTRIAIIGLGYVGLPLALAFASHYPVIGVDTDSQRVSDLGRGMDRTREVPPEKLQQATRLSFTSHYNDLLHCNTYIVTVPTPIDSCKRPDLQLLKTACENIAPLLSPGDLVVFESTVYPGATEEVCIPVLETHSGLQFNEDFFVGYSPERINPGDSEHPLTAIRKITSGSTADAARRVDSLYRQIITAGTCQVSSIRVAEAAKVIENTQRDVNIALINELAILFHRLDLNTTEVLKAAGSKWNFLPFTPGLVGGHCIGVDPYYLTHKAQEVGHHTEMILAGRRLNDTMGMYVAGRVIKLMASREIPLVGARVLILGLTFKENCADIRNTRVVDLVQELSAYHVQTDIYDPWADPEAAERELGITLTATLEKNRYDGIIVAVAHDQFRAMSIEEVRSLGKTEAVVFDIKSVFPNEAVDGAL